MGLLIGKSVFNSYSGPIAQSCHVVPYSQTHVHGIQLQRNWKIGLVDDLKRYVDRCNVNKGKSTYMNMLVGHEEPVDNLVSTDITYLVVSAGMKVQVMDV